MDIRDTTPGERHPEQWVIRTCPLCRCPVEGPTVSHTGNCANRDKLFAVDEQFVVPAAERDRLREAARTLGSLWRGNANDAELSMAILELEEAAGLVEQEGS